MSSPTKQFASIPELLSCLGRNVVNRKLMYDLCLTSKSFNASFTPFLYAEFWIRSTNAQFLVENVQLLLGNSSLKCTKGLDVAIRPYSRLDTGHDEGTLSELYNKGVQALLMSMPELTHFTYVLPPNPLRSVNGSSVNIAGKQRHSPQPPYQLFIRIVLSFDR